MDIRPPKRRPALTPPTNLAPSPAPVIEKLVTIEAPELQDAPSSFSITEKQVSKPKRKKYIILAVLAVLVALVAATIGWYTWATSPRSSSETSQTFVIKSGEAPSVIARNLEQAQLIRSSFAFEIYAKLHGLANNLRAGSYKLSPNQSVATIISELTLGQDSTRNVFIPPGLTLKQLADPSIKGSFAAQGFSNDEIQQAFNATYKSKLLGDKPANTSLEGYIFPETFQIKEGDTLQSVLERSFDTLYERLQTDDMMQKFTARGLTLHGALTLGSIVQEETSDIAVQRQVAQVFLTRIDLGMTLGSDVTFIYAARQLGVEATSTLDSPYNTRIHAGLPPGPIATMNYSALQAVAEPSEGDYLFFVAGDDGTVHFSRTNEEHEQQVQQYCQKLCSASIQ